MFLLRCYVLNKKTWWWWWVHLRNVSRSLLYIKVMGQGQGQGHRSKKARFCVLYKSGSKFRIHSTVTTFCYAGRYLEYMRQVRSKSKAGMVHSVSGWTRGVQVKLWDPLRTRAIPERLRGVFTTRRNTNTRLPLPLPLQVHISRSEGKVQDHRNKKRVCVPCSRLSAFVWKAISWRWISIVIVEPPPSLPKLKINARSNTLPAPCPSPSPRANDGKQLLLERRDGPGFRIQLPIQRSSLSDRSPSPSPRRVRNILLHEIKRSATNKQVSK